MKKLYSSPIRVVIADDSSYYREGLKSIIAQKANDHIEVVGEAENGRELIDIVNSTAPDVILTEIKLPVMNGFEAARILCNSHSFIPILALSNLTEEKMILEMLEAGAKGHVTKNITVEELVKAVETVSKGEIYYSSSTTSSLVRMISKSSTNIGVTFSEKENHFIQLLCNELSTKEIADKMSVSIRSVEDYCKRIKEKTNTRSMVGIALYAMRNEIVSSEYA